LAAIYAPTISDPLSLILRTRKGEIKLEMQTPSRALPNSKTPNQHSNLFENSSTQRITNPLFFSKGTPALLHHLSTFCTKLNTIQNKYTTNHFLTNEKVLGQFPWNWKARRVALCIVV